MQRIAIIGSAGTGKSTLARLLGERLGLPVIHLDRLHWKPGWKAVPRDQWQAMQEELVARDRWIIDGNYDRTLPIRLERADTVIYLDFSPLICVGRVIRRAVFSRSPRPDVDPGCRERPFTRDFANFLLWILRYRIDNRPRVVAFLRSFATNKRIITLKSPSQLSLLLRRTLP